ncbi:MAG: ATP-dependent 6-phosphofructokinase [Bacteroidetes bacterium]|nr:ATP-dependent 6-phosphofructokinase [Bacteroidota bacterium]MBU1422087.1 ATP-dependent 6-phosphofructokinase [Bacteroidota bacterium]
MRIGILTGGGDVPGLNPAIKAVVHRAIDAGHDVIGIRRGWAGLLYYNPDDPKTYNLNLIPLTKSKTRTIDRTGGTVLHTSRTNPGKVRFKEMPEFLFDKNKQYEKEKAIDFTPHVLSVLKHLNIEALITIGGDDTLSYAVRLHKEGFPVVAIPKTMDNDVFGTDYCIGFSTAVTRSVDFIDALRTPAGSHERIAVIELFGRYSGETSLISAYLAGVDRAIISEVDFDIDKLCHFLDEDKKNNPSNYAIVTISEGAKMVGGDMVITGEPDAYGHKKLGGIGYILSQEIQKRTGHLTIYQQVAYLMRSGGPDALDRMVSTSYGHLAADLINQKQFGRMVALQDGKYTTVSIDIITQGRKRVDVRELYDAENYRPRIKHFLNKPMFLY